MEAFLVSTGIVVLAKIGDTTQLLTFRLAAKFRRPESIVAAILIATIASIANHAFAAIGSWIANRVSLKPVAASPPRYLRCRAWPRCRAWAPVR